MKYEEFLKLRTKLKLTDDNIIYSCMAIFFIIMLIILLKKFI